MTTIAQLARDTNGIYTPGTAAALAQLNAYDGDNIWQDLILAADWYDDDATDAIDTGTNDRLVTTTGDEIEYDHQAREWVRA